MKRVSGGFLTTAVVSTFAGGLLAGCGNVPKAIGELKVGGAPQTSVDACVKEAARLWRIPAEKIVHDAGVSVESLKYRVSVKADTASRTAACTTDQNGVVIDFVYQPPSSTRG